MGHEDNIIGAGEPSEENKTGMSADYWMGAYDAVMSLARQALHEWGRAAGGCRGDARRTREDNSVCGGIDAGTGIDPHE